MSGLRPAYMHHKICDISEIVYIPKDTLCAVLFCIIVINCGIKLIIINPLAVYPN